MSRSESLRIDSIEQIFGMLGRRSPANPLLAVIGASWQEPLNITVPVSGRAIVSGLYALSLKRGDECHGIFGRQVYDGQAGSIVFLAPGQTMSPLASAAELEHEGEAWTVVFHPELLRDRPLGALMHQYRFFTYAARESLHLDENERRLLTGVVQQLEHEASGPPDSFALEVLTAHLQLLFSYCQRAYARQFQLRNTVGGSVATRLDQHLAQYLSGEARQRGLPTVKSCARVLGYSPDYLSDLLRAETGINARDHIHAAVMEAAKARLLSSASLTASEVAHELGFEHAPHFSRLFRSKTGQSPLEWRRARAANGSTAGGVGRKPRSM